MVRVMRDCVGGEEAFVMFGCGMLSPTGQREVTRDHYERCAVNLPSSSPSSARIKKHQSNHSSHSQFICGLLMDSTKVQLKGFTSRFQTSHTLVRFSPVPKGVYNKAAIVCVCLPPLSDRPSRCSMGELLTRRVSAEVPRTFSHISLATFVCVCVCVCVRGL